MKLTVHTRGNVSPKDKPSVFLLSAPGDDEPRKALLTALLSHDAGGNVAV